MKRPTPDNPRKVRTIFISDWHMGYKGFDVSAALDFMKAHDCDHLYLLGDIFDGWKLEKRWYCPQSYADLIDEIIRKQKSGTRVYYTPGNHDDKLSNIVPTLSRPLIEIALKIDIDDRFVHMTANGKRLLCLHGHQFDSAIVDKLSKPADLTNVAITQHLDIIFERMRQWFVNRGLMPPARKFIVEGHKESRYSLGKAIAKGGTYLLKRFNQAAVMRAIEGDYDGIVYGHSHVAELRIQKGKIIANCGSFTLKKENAPKGRHTALIETDSGELELIDWPMMRPIDKDKKNKDLAAESLSLSKISCQYKQTRHILRLVHSLWAPRPSKS